MGMSKHAVSLVHLRVFTSSGEQGSGVLRNLIFKLRNVMGIVMLNWLFILNNWFLIIVPVSVVQWRALLDKPPETRGQFLPFPFNHNVGFKRNVDLMSIVLSVTSDSTNFPISVGKQRELLANAPATGVLVLLRVKTKRNLKHYIHTFDWVSHSMCESWQLS